MMAGRIAVYLWRRRPKFGPPLSERLSSTPAGVGRCQKCGKPLDHILLCSHCKGLQKNHSEIDYYELLGIPKDYRVQNAVLKNKYLSLQSQLHPDKGANASGEDKALFERYSSLLNEAYQTLSDPLERGLYLMKGRGVQVEENIIQTDGKFLSEVMEFNEELEKVSSPEDVRRLEALNKARVESLSKEIDSAFASNDLEAAKLKLAKLKYYYSNKDRLKKKKIELKISD